MVGDGWAAATRLGLRRWQQRLDNGSEFTGYDLFRHTEHLGMAEAAFKVLKGVVSLSLIHI